MSEKQVVSQKNAADYETGFKYIPDRAGQIMKTNGEILFKIYNEIYNDRKIHWIRKLFQVSGILCIIDADTLTTEAFLAAGGDYA